MENNNPNPEEKKVYDLDAAFGNEEKEEQPEIKEEEEEEEEEEPEIKEEEKPEIKEEEKGEEEVDVDALISEKFGFSPDEIEDQLLELAELKEKVKEGPKFGSELQKKIYTFVTGLGEVDDLNEATRTYLSLATMDVKSMDDKTVLQERFMLENADMPREQALKKFNRKFEKEYTSIDEEEQEDLDFDLKREANKARKELESKVQELKPDPAKKTEEEYKVPEIVSKSIEVNQELIKKSFKGFDGVVLSVDGSAENNFKFVLKKDQIKEVEARLLNSINRPELYDEKGEYRPGFEAEASRDALTRALYGDQMMEAYGKHCLNIGYEKRALELSGARPDRNGAMGSKTEPASIEEGFEQLAATRRARKQQNN